MVALPLRRNQRLSFRSRQEWWLALLLPFLWMDLAEAGRAVALSRVEIQAVRSIHKYYQPSRLSKLSQVGQDTLFGERAKDLELVVVGDSGTWQWRTKSDPALTSGGPGSPDDGVILYNCINCSGLDAPQWGMLTCEQINFELRHARIWITSGGSMHMDNPDLLQLLNLAHSMMSEENLPRKVKDRISGATGELLLELPSNEQMRLKARSPKLGNLIERSTSDAIKADRAAVQKIDTATLARETQIDYAADALVLTADGKTVKPRLNLRRMKDHDNLVVVPLDAEGELIIRTADPSLSVEKINEAGVEEFLKLTEQGSLELFLREGDSVRSVPKDRWQTKTKAIMRRLRE